MSAWPRVRLLAGPVGVLGPPVAWSVHLLLTYFIVAAVGDDLTLVRVLVGLLTAAALAIAAGSAALPASFGRRPVQGRPVTVARFERRLAQWSGALFFAAILLTAWPVFVLGHFG